MVQLTIVRGDYVWSSAQYINRLVEYILRSGGRLSHMLSRFRPSTGITRLPHRHGTHVSTEYISDAQ